MEQENDLLKQYWEHITRDDLRKITWDEASQNIEATKGLRESSGFAMFKASFALRDAFRQISDSVARLLNLK
jgi:hypothetical protein